MNGLFFHGINVVTHAIHLGKNALSFAKGLAF